MTRAQLLAQAEGLILDAEQMRDCVARVDPSREYLAQAVIDDAVRAYVLMETSSRITARIRMEVSAYYVRAKFMSDALNAPIQ